MQKVLLIVLSFLLCFGKTKAELNNNTFNCNSLTITDTLSKINQDTSKTKIVLDTLRPLNYVPFTTSLEHSISVNNKSFELYDYRYTGDIFSYLPFGYLQDLGFLGQPNEATIYGSGFGNISYLRDGVPVNNRMQNSLDLYNIQLESVDSLEVLPLPRGFLGGSFFNSVSVNFITRNTFYAKPYTKIRFYQGDTDEGVVDFLFHTYVTKKLGVKFNISNYSIGTRYENTEYGNWQASISAKYNFTNYINFILSYHYSKEETKLNGGVDLDYIKSDLTNRPIDAYVFDQYLATVKYTDRYQKSRYHSINFTILAEIIKALPASVNFYVQSNLNEFRQNEFAKLSDEDTLIHNNKYNLAGLNFSQKILIPYFNSTFSLNLERVSYYTDILTSNSKINSISFSGVNKLTILNNIVPSVFYKFSNYNNITLFGLGGDVNINIMGCNIYAGLSTFKKPFSPVEDEFLGNIADYQTINNYEAGISYKTPDFNISARYFLSYNNKTPFAIINKLIDTVKTDYVTNYFIQETKTHGANLNFSKKIWKILITNNASLFFTKADQKNELLPKYSVNAGIYYIDTLFNSNLKLKAGLNFKMSGKQDGRIYDFERSVAAYYINTANLGLQQIDNEFSKSSFQMDFFMAAKIQDAAIIYFVFQNLLNEENFYVSIYPKQGRGIRLGFNWELFN